MERVAWWWNRKYGRLARRDVYVYTDGGLFRVEAVAGGVEGKRQSWDRLGRYEAWDAVKALLAEQAVDWMKMV